MRTMRLEEVCYETLDYDFKPLQIKLPLFHFSHGLHEINFLEMCIYVNKQQY